MLAVTDRECCCRPAAFAHGATDELTHCLGHHRVHLGLNMAATAVPLASDDTAENAQANSEDVVLYFGIIDILQVNVLLHTGHYREWE